MAQRGDQLVVRMDFGNASLVSLSRAVDQLRALLAVLEAVVQRDQTLRPDQLAGPARQRRLRELLSKPAHRLDLGAEVSDLALGPDGRTIVFTLRLADGRDANEVVPVLLSLCRQMGQARAVTAPGDRGVAATDLIEALDIPRDESNHLLPRVASAVTGLVRLQSVETRPAS